MPTRRDLPGLRGPRSLNERLVLQAIRQHGALAGAGIARLTGLTAQTVSLITRRLEGDGLLRRGEPVRGKVGQPAVPLSLDPDGAYAVGVQIGRRSLDTLLVDLSGAVRQRWRLDYRQPEPQALLAEIGRRLDGLRTLLAPEAHARVQGVGVAAPLQLGGWQALLDMPADLAARWQALDLQAAVAGCTDLPVQMLKDTAAACVAELAAAPGGGEAPSFLYVFIDTFAGGGLVLDGQLRAGRRGNAGAVGSLALGLASASAPAGSAPPQLLSVASLLGLERRYLAAGLDAAAAADARALQPPWQAHTTAWLADAAAALALAAHDAACLLDLDGLVVDGACSRPLLAALLGATEQAMAGYSWEGVARPPLRAGRVGPDARALGGAWLPLHAAFAPEAGRPG